MSCASVNIGKSYHPFGSVMPGRGWNLPKYRYGFNGMEKSDEIADGLFTTPFREIDTRIGGRWWSIDPIVKPWESPYVGFSNNPIVFSDPSGLQSTTGDDDIIYYGGEIDEVIVTKKKKPTASRTPTSEIEQDDYYGSMKSYRKDFNIPDNMSDEQIREQWDNNYGNTGEWDEELVRISQQAKVYDMMQHLQLWDSYARVIKEPVILYSLMITGEGNITTSGSSIFSGLTVVRLVTEEEIIGMTFLTAKASANSGVLAYSVAKSNLWRVGAYSELRGMQIGLDAHHVGQQALMKKLIPGYNYYDAPAILVPFRGHTTSAYGIGVLSRSTRGITSARQVLARDIFELRRVYGVPNSQLQRLIQMNKMMYPSSF